MDGVHLISHGEPGQISFANTQLNTETLPEYVHLLEGWGDSLSAEADLLVYGCDVASGEDGNSLIQQISQITDADVAASVDDTGHTDRGGDWSLEISTGEIESASIFEPGIESAYQHTLDEFGFTTGSLPDFNSTDLSSTSFDFTSVPADSLTVFADAGLNFSDVDASTLDNIDFNEIPSEDLEILQDAGLKLEPLSSDEIAEINLDALSGFDYLPDDIKFSNLSEIDEGTTFAEISDLAVANAELFDYKADLEIEDELSIEQLSEFSRTDFEALNFAAQENNNKAIFDSDFYLKEYPSVKEAGVNPYANYEAFGTDGDRYPNLTFKIFGESENALAISADLSGEKFESSKELVKSRFESIESLPEAEREKLNFDFGDEEGTKVAGVFLIPVAIKTGEAIFFTAVTLEAYSRATTGKGVLENAADLGIKVFSTPLNDDGEISSTNTGGETSSEDEVTTTIPGFDLSAATEIDPNTLPQGSDFIEDILNGQFEFPDAEEGGSYFLAIDDPNPILNDLRESATLNNVTSNGMREYQGLSGGFEQANETFDSIELKNVKPLKDSKFEGRVGTLDDGRKVIVRSGSTQTELPTIEIQNAKGRIKDKFRFNE